MTRLVARVLVILRTTARREILGFEERLEEVIVGALRSSVPEGKLDHELASFILVRVVLAVVQSVVVDRPKLNTTALVDELTRLVVGYVGLGGGERTKRSSTPKAHASARRA